MNFAKYRVQLSTEKKYTSKYEYKYEYEYSIPVFYKCTEKKFRMDGITDVCCPLCYLEDEIVNMLIHCPAFSEFPITYINELVVGRLIKFINHWSFSVN